MYFIKRWITTRTSTENADFINIFVFNDHIACSGIKMFPPSLVMAPSSFLKGFLKGDLSGPLSPPPFSIIHKLLL